MRRDDAERLLWSIMKIELVIIAGLLIVLLVRAVQHT